MSDVIQSLLGRGDVSFEPEDIAKLVAGFESTLANLGLKEPQRPGDNSHRLADRSHPRHKDARTSSKVRHNKALSQRHPGW
jgi:hypothetical protein